MLIVFAMAAITIYGFNSYSQTLRSEQAREQRDYINQSITEKFQENFDRQNVLGNVTTAEILEQTKDIDKLLMERTPRFAKIENMLNASIENQRTIIYKQYRYSQEDALNVSGISNETR